MSGEHVTAGNSTWLGGSELIYKKTLVATKVDYGKVNKITEEIRSLSREEFLHIRRAVDNIAYHGNPLWDKSVKESVSVGAEMVRRMFAAYDGN